MPKAFLTVVILLSMTACSSISTRTPQQDTKVFLKDSTGEKREAPAESSSSDEKEITRVSPNDTEMDAAQSQIQKQAQAHEVKEAVAAAAEHIQTTHGHATHRETGPVPADKAYGWLRNGNTRFVKGMFRNDGALPKDRHRLASGQKPHSVVLSCSDSRVPPEVVFDQKLGEIFVVRTAGEALDHNVIGSIEYAVEHLGTNLIVVMGHESCGAVKAALASLQGADLGSPHITALVDDLKPRVQQYATQPPSKGHLDESWANVNGVAKDLIERSAVLRDALTTGEVKIVKAMYHLDSGRVEWR